MQIVQKSYETCYDQLVQEKSFISTIKHQTVQFIVEVKAHVYLYIAQRENEHDVSHHHDFTPSTELTRD